MLLKNFWNKWKHADSAFKLFIYGVLFLGINNGIQNSSFNNFLHDIYNLNASERGFLEFPRELPGFLLVFITILLGSYSCRIWAIMVGVITGIGMLGLGFFSKNYASLIFWMFLWSIGEHLYMTVESTMGLKLAKANAEGKKLGQVTGARNLAMIIGAVIVWLGFDKIGLSYPGLYFIAFLAAIASSYAFYRIKIDKSSETKKIKFVFKKKYSLFYYLNIMFGVRKQLYLTFSPWVLVSVFNTKAQTIALLVAIACLLGFVFRQQFGHLVDKYGERIILTADSIITIIICIGFAFTKNIYVLFAFYIIDNLMFSSRIARTTYLSKIIDCKEEIAPTLSLGTTMDHAVSMVVPLAGGLIWSKYGYPAVFIFAAFFAIINLMLTVRIKTDK